MPKVAKRIQEDDFDEDDDIPAAGRNVKRGHNNPPSDSGESSSERLKSFIARIERLEEDKAAVQEDIKDVYAEVKSSGFDVKVVRAVIRRRKQEKSELEEFEELLDLYLSALGMV